MKKPPADALSAALRLHQAGQFADALKIYEALLQKNPRSADLCFLAGTALLRLKRLPKAHDYLARAARLRPSHAETHFNLGSVLKALGRLEEAVTSLRTAQTLQPNYFEALFNLANTLAATGKHADALPFYQRVVTLKPDYGPGVFNLALTLLETDSAEDALSTFDRAIALGSDVAEAHCCRGRILKRLGRWEEAQDSYAAAVVADPTRADARNDQANLLVDLGRLAEAVHCYDDAIRLKPDLAAAHYNRANALLQMHRLPDALESYDRALEFLDDKPEVHSNRANVLDGLRRPEEALAGYSRVLALDSEFDFARSAKVYMQMKICDWENLDSQLLAITQRIKEGLPAARPFAMLAVIDDPLLHRRTSEIHHKRLAAGPRPVEIRPANDRAEKIKIGYFSADFHDHATAHLMAQMLESHDRDRFELTAFTFGSRKIDHMTLRILSCFSAVVDANDMTDSAVANAAREREIDIAVDLKGYTANGRHGIFAAGCAPLQVNFLGYPGTLGASWMDYIIADEVVIPRGAEDGYSEKIVRLPGSYQVNDAGRRIADTRFTRAEVGLPETGFVFCCFNNNYKITPWVFDRWMQILQAVDGSVLWLLEDNSHAARNLRREAEARGVDSSRLVFAKRMKIDEHLARHALADLFLDTLPCNAHTTASDALWAGLPVLTCAGRSFAARVAASLLTAIDVPELITQTLEDYTVAAIRLANNPLELAELRSKIARNRATSPLFDGKIFARHLERAFAHMFERHQAGLAPDNFSVEPDFAR